MRIKLASFCSFLNGIQFRVEEALNDPKGRATLQRHNAVVALCRHSSTRLGMMADRRPQNFLPWIFTSPKGDILAKQPLPMLTPSMLL
jgi:hypothetical protein